MEEQLIDVNVKGAGLLQLAAKISGNWHDYEDEVKLNLKPKDYAMMIIHSVGANSTLYIRLRYPIEGSQPSIDFEISQNGETVNKVTFSEIKDFYEVGPYNVSMNNEHIPTYELPMEDDDATIIKTLDRLKRAIQERSYLGLPDDIIHLSNLDRIKSVLDEYELY